MKSIQYNFPDNSIRYHHTISPQQHGYLIYPAEVHNLYELMYIKSGLVEHTIDGEKYILQSGDLVLIDFHEIHSLKISGKVEYNRYGIHFNKDSLPIIDKQSLIKPFGIKNKQERILRKNIVSKYNLARLFEDMDSIASENDDYSQSLIIAKLLEILVTIQKISNEVSNNSIPDNINIEVKKIIKYIDENLDKKISLDDLSQKLLISKYYMSHIFKNYMNTSVTNYILLRKINHASNLISSGLPATEAAKNIGYDNYSSFYFAFKKIMGCSPSDVKKGKY